MSGVTLEGFKGLFNTESIEDEVRTINIMSVDALVVGKYQPRTDFDELSLKDLSASIKTNGIIQPLIVRKCGSDNRYEIIAGERRWRAAKMADLVEVPVIIRNVSDNLALVFALIENIQREDLNPIDRAAALFQLKDEFSLTHEKIADVVGLSRPSVTNLMRLLELPKEIKTFLQKGKLTAGQAKPLLAIGDPKKQLEIANKTIRKSLSARAVESLVQKHKTSPIPTNFSKTSSEEKIQEWGVRLSKHLSLPVQVYFNRRGQGRVVIQTDCLEDLTRLISRLKINE